MNSLNYVIRFRLNGTTTVVVSNGLNVELVPLLIRNADRVKLQWLFEVSCVM